MEEIPIKPLLAHLSSRPVFSVHDMNRVNRWLKLAWNMVAKGSNPNLIGFVLLELVGGVGRGGGPDGRAAGSGREEGSGGGYGDPHKRAMGTACQDRRTAVMGTATAGMTVVAAGVATAALRAPSCAARPHVEHERGEVLTLAPNHEKQ